MLNIFSFFFKKDLINHLNETKTVKVKGIKFVIKRLNAINYMDGSKTIKQIYDIYKTKGESAYNDIEQNQKKMIEHFSHVFVGAVVNPRLTLNKEDQGIWVNDLFVDWDMVVELYTEIMQFTYGKKKVKQLALLEKK